RAAFEKAPDFPAGHDCETGISRRARAQDTTQRPGLSIVLAEARGQVFAPGAGGIEKENSTGLLALRPVESENTPLANGVRKLAIEDRFTPGLPAIPANGMGSAILLEIISHAQQQGTLAIGQFRHLAFVHVRTNRPTCLPGLAMIIAVDHVRTPDESG